MRSLYSSISVLTGLLVLGLAASAAAADPIPTAAELVIKPYRTGDEKRVNNPVDVWMLAHSGPGGKAVQGPARYRFTDGWAGRFEILDATDARRGDFSVVFTVANLTRVSRSKVQTGQRHAFRVRTVCEEDQAEVVAELDGEPYFRWNGPESKLDLVWKGWDVPHQRTIGIGVEKGSVTYHDLTLKMLSGEAWLLRPKP